jgi:hypothetical protein
LRLVLIALDHPFAVNAFRRRQRDERLCGQFLAIRNARVDHLDDGAREMTAERRTIFRRYNNFGPRYLENGLCRAWSFCLPGLRVWRDVSLFRQRHLFKNVAYQNMRLSRGQSLGDDPFVDE